MKTKSLTSGTTSLEVSALCLGTMNLGVGVDQETSFSILDRYYEGGGRFLDTANNYGSWGDDSATEGGSELVVGRWLASRKVAGEMVLATKSGAGKRDPAGRLAGSAPTNFEGLSPAVVREQLTTSLKRLGVDRVGVYYGHVDDRTLEASQIADTFSALAEEGLIAIPGISNAVTWRVAQAREHARRQGRPEFGVWQQQHSIYWPAPGSQTGTTVGPDAIEYAADFPDLTIVTYSSQQGGQLVRPWMPLRPEYDHPSSHARLRLVHRIAHELSASANQVALAWHLAGPRASIRYEAGSSRAHSDQLPVRRASMLPVIGASRAEHIDEALGALTITLDPTQLKELDAP